MKKLQWYPIVLIISLILAEWASRPGEKGKKGGEVWLKLGEKAEFSIKYIDEKQIVDVSTDDWVKVQKIKDNTPMPPLQFKGSNRVEDVRNKLSTLYAYKVIGLKSELKLEDYELADEKKTLSINVVGGGEHNFIIGKRSFQTSNVYLLDQAKQTVILADRTPLNFLRNPKARLFEAKPYSFTLKEDIKSATIEFGSDRKELEMKVSDKGKVTWMGVDSDKELENEGSWLSNYLKLRVSRYPLDHEKEALAKLQPTVTVTLKDQSKEVEKITLYHWAKDASEGESYWIKSSYLGEFGVVSSTKAKTLIQDFKNLL